MPARLAVRYEPHVIEPKTTSRRCYQLCAYDSPGRNISSISTRVREWQAHISPVWVRLTIAMQCTRNQQACQPCAEKRLHCLILASFQTAYRPAEVVRRQNGTHLVPHWFICVFSVQWVVSSMGCLVTFPNAEGERVNFHTVTESG